MPQYTLLIPAREHPAIWDALVAKHFETLGDVLTPSIEKETHIEMRYSTKQVVLVMSNDGVAQVNERDVFFDGDNNAWLKTTILSKTTGFPMHTKTILTAQEKRKLLGIANTHDTAILNGIIEAYTNSGCMTDMLTGHDLAMADELDIDIYADDFDIFKDTWEFTPTLLAISDAATDIEAACEHLSLLIN